MNAPNEWNWSLPILVGSHVPNPQSSCGLCLSRGTVGEFFRAALSAVGVREKEIVSGSKRIAGRSVAEPEKLRSATGNQKWQAISHFRYSQIADHARHPPLHRSSKMKGDHLDVRVGCSEQSLQISIKHPVMSTPSSTLITFAILLSILPGNAES